MSRPQPARPPLGNAYLFGLLQLPQLGHCLEKKNRDPFSGPCLGSENGANFANKLGSEFEKRAAKRKLANLPQTARSLGKRAAEKIKATTFRSGLNPHELFATLWSNREGPNR